jgi:membrane fusion protein (multidrug efflux system)
LYETHASARSALDQALADKKQAAANVAKEQQIIEQKTITAPFAGKLGIREVNLGQYINPGDAMVTLQSLNPLYVNFSLPEQDISYLRLGQKVGVKVDSYPGTEFRGKLTAISSKVDPQTRSISLQATIPNASYELVPGNYAQVKVYRDKAMDVVVVPQTAITYRLYGDSVYKVVDTGKKDKNGKALIYAELGLVKVGPNIGANVVIEKGVKAGESVVTAGQIKLQTKTRITPDRSVDMTSGKVSNEP